MAAGECQHSCIRGQLTYAAVTCAGARTAAYELGTQPYACEKAQAAVLLLDGSSTVVLAGVQQCMC
jgi:hypothetical protein